MTAESLPSAKDYQKPYVLAIDIGSSSVKAALYDADARVIESTVSTDSHKLRSTSDGGAILDGNDIAERVEDVIDSVIDKAGDFAEHIGGVGMDALASTILGLDDNGNSVTPIYTYADTRSRDYVEKLRDKLNVEEVYQRTGCPQHTAYAPARFLWLRETGADTFQKARLWADVGTFLYTRWFGRMDVPASYSIASWSGLLNRHELCWDEDLLSLLDISTDLLPPLADHSAGQTGLSEQFSKRWPALKEVPFFLNVGDGASANVGSGCVTRERVALTVGTSGAMRVLTPVDADVPKGLWAYHLSKLHLVGGSFSDGGSVFAWAKNNLHLSHSKELEAELVSLKPDDHGITVLPFFSGERSPGWATNARATIAGLSMSTSPIQILQALLESVAYRFGIVWNMLKPLASDNAQIIASGGAIRNSPNWLQMMADVLQQPVTIVKEEEATRKGTAILVLHALGVLKELDTITLEQGETYEPNPKRAFAYQKGMERQQELYESLLGSKS